MTTNSTQAANGTSEIEAIRARMDEIRAASATARKNRDSRTLNALDGEMTELGQRLRNLRTTHDYTEDRCCSSCP